MTRQEFLKYASMQPLFDVYHKLYSESELTHKISQYYKSGSNPQKIIDYFMGIGDVEFERIETVSKDILRISLLYSAGSNYYWNEISSAVQYVGAVSNCAGTIAIFYLSEQGKFYNQNHKVIAENEDDFFDYITTVEYDFHPEIPRRTYHIMRHFGWYEGRHIDTSEFEQKMKKCGIEFTKIQLDFLSEFSDLYFSLPGVNWNFLSLNDILKNYTSMPTNPKKPSKVITKHAFTCGYDDGGSLYLTADGLIATSQNNPLGRTTMECINHLCNYSHENEPWLDELLKQDETKGLK
ncbi:MAG: hypothetical protein NC299_10050 [Lachnospiraceae bacterium]|nr:hypothetical protein [Ruminococcus sp.]MCM1275693.1 hypothetical protein [Lachnospiraceae bacterium]